MKIIKIISLVICLLVGGFLGYAQFRPDSYRVERSIVISAPSNKILPFILDLKAFTLWNPWDKIDPNMKKKFTGASSGVGAIYEWEGNKHVGVGKLTIKKVDPSQRVSMELEYIKPMAGISTAEFMLEKHSRGTKVAWILYGKQTFIAKICTVFINMDQMVGREFEKGLAELKTLSEK